MNADGGIAVVGLMALRQACPLMLAAMGGILSERSGVINIALEGLMLTGAFVAVWVGASWGCAAGFVSALAVATVMAGVHLVLTQRLRTNQIVSGVALNLLALHASTFLLRSLFHQATPPREARVAETLPLGWFIGAALVLPLLLHGFLYHTKLGLRIRAVGEDPGAARMAGVNPSSPRAYGVLASGLLAGAAGAFLSLSLVGRFTDDMVGGRGFIALAAVVCGRWTPIGAALACLAFGTLDALQLHLQGAVALPAELLRTMPYVFTIVAAALFRSYPPAGLGRVEDD